MVRTINFLVQKHTFSDDHNDILGLAADVEAAWQAAIAHERERCAKVAEETTIRCDCRWDCDCYTYWNMKDKIVDALKEDRDE